MMSKMKRHMMECDDEHCDICRPQGRIVRELAQVINRYSRENESNTPDFVLATYMMKCLEAGERLIQDREMWYGVKNEPKKRTAKR